MTNRLIAGVALVAVLAGGCATGTAHRLSIAGSLVADEAAACELRCRAKLPPKPPSTCPTDTDPLESASPKCRTDADRTPYVLCLDQCPGATASDGASCPEAPAPGVVCETTYRPSTAGLVGGTVAVAAAALVVGFVIGLNAPREAFGLPR